MRALAFACDACAVLFLARVSKRSIAVWNFPYTDRVLTPAAICEIFAIKHRSRPVPGSPEREKLGPFAQVVSPSVSGG